VRSEDSSFYLEYIGASRLYKIEFFSQSNFAKINKEHTRINAKKNQINEKARLYFLRFNIIVAKTVRI
jgi:hypothetical protein